jgi:hypothetical protein
MLAAQMDAVDTVPAVLAMFVVATKAFSEAIAVTVTALWDPHGV